MHRARAERTKPHRGYLRGHPIVFRCGEWRYADNGEPTAGNRRAMCGVCGGPDTPEGHDACLGTLPGVVNACCGHGKPDESYIQFANGVTVRGFTRVGGGTDG